MSDIEMEEAPLPPVAHARLVYLGAVAPHWEIQSDWGDEAMIEAFRSRVRARLVLLPPHDPQLAHLSRAFGDGGACRQQLCAVLERRRRTR